MKENLRQLLFKILNLINLITLIKNRISPNDLDIRGFLILQNSNGQISIGQNAIINSSKYKNIIGGDTRSSIIVKKNAQLIIGSNFRMSNSAIYCANKIQIGNNVMIGGSCKLWDTDFHPLSAKERADNPNSAYNTKPIIIGNNVFIGGFSIILKGVTIGDGSIIGAGSVVSQNIPESEVWAGNPARFIKKIIT